MLEPSCCSGLWKHLNHIPTFDYVPITSRRPTASEMSVPFAVKRAHMSILDLGRYWTV